MKIKIYFVTYRNDAELNNTLRTFLHSGARDFPVEITIINNYKLEQPRIENFDLPYTIVSNETRPGFSTGHLARNWNECLMDGFKDIDHPDADIVMLCQNDVEFHPGVFPKVIEAHQRYNFISGGAGDAFHSYTIDAIKNVGLWDERFCNIGWQEGDYFLRQLIYNKQGCSINDVSHGRVHNTLDYEILWHGHQTGFSRQDIHHLESLKYHDISLKTFIKKWGWGIPGVGWVNPITQYEGPVQYNMAYDIGPEFFIREPQWIIYPYFESKIKDLKSKGYINYE